MQAVIETGYYLRQAKKAGVAEAERHDIVDFIADHPQAGDEISGTGGARKLRFARQGTGKSGGYRVITFYSGPDIPVFLLNIFSKSGKENISQAERNELRETLATLAKSYRRKKQHG